MSIVQSDGGDKADNLKKALETLARNYGAAVNPRDNTMLIVGAVCASIGALIIVFGIAVTIKYCRSERAQGKSYGKILQQMTNRENF